MDTCAQAAAGVNDSPTKYARPPAGGRSWELQKTFARWPRAEPVLQTEVRASTRGLGHGGETFTEMHQFNVPGALIRHEGGWQEKMLKQYP